MINYQDWIHKGKAYCLCIYWAQMPILPIPTHMQEMLKYRPYGRNNFYSLGYWSYIHWHRIKVTQKTLVQQLLSCLGLRLRSEMVILLKTNNLCIRRDISFLCSCGVLAVCEYEYGKIALGDGRCPAIHRPLDVFSVCLQS